MNITFSETNLIIASIHFNIEIHSMCNEHIHHQIKVNAENDDYYVALHRLPNVQGLFQLFMI
jgi:hypothetical protein